MTAVNQSTPELLASLRAHVPSRRPSIAAALMTLLFAAHVSTASAQFKLQQTFTDTSAPGWTLSGSSLLTAPSIDSAGQGWLRLTDTGNTEKGLALDTAESFAGNAPVTLRFSYVSWGGTGADGITVFLYDSTQDMSGALTGGGLGYCGGAGGYVALGVDEYGNFSNPGDKCGAGSGGPGRVPESVVLRGPLSAQDQYVTGVPVSGGIDNPGVATRPEAKTILLTLTPATLGYTATVLFQAATGAPYQTLFSNVSLPYAAPANLSVGISGSTGGSTNNHELQGLVTASPDDLQLMMNGPTTILPGTPVTYTLTVTNNGSYPIGVADAPLVTDTLPAAITGSTWTCTAAGGATCTASGAGNLSTSGLTLPSNASVTYSITGTLDPASTCGATVTNSAHADFGSASTFIDPDPTNNNASVSSTVTCMVTLVANPATLSFGPQTVGAPSAVQTITVTGTHGALISNIATTGDFTQTNNCSVALTAGTTCTIEVVFTPASEASLNGTLVITSSASSSPTVVALSGTGTNGVPNAFNFVPLNNVDPSTAQVSNAITVTGTNVPTTISISSGAEYSINGGAFTSTPGVVSPGAQVIVRATSSSSYETSVSVVLTIGGVSATFTVTTGAQPQLQNVTVTSGGGGALSLWFVLALALVLAPRLGRRPHNITVVLLALLGAAASHPSAAANWEASRLYFGGALGEVTSTLTPSKVTSRLEADGYQVVATDVQRSSLSGSAYVGYELPRQFAVEAGWSYLGRTQTKLQGVAPPDLDQLLDDAASVTRGSGDAWFLVGRYRWVLQPKLALDLRAGPYRWITHSDLWIGSAEQVNRNDRGWGYMLGLGPRYVLSEHWAVALNANYFASTTDNRFVQVIASIEYRLR
jgi:Domain of unknown function DUF11/Outer membrane protein beta-barrel domain/Bacterial lectin